jgi:hypothetical protein
MGAVIALVIMRHSGAPGSLFPALNRAPEGRNTLKKGGFSGFFRLFLLCNIYGYSFHM